MWQTNLKILLTVVGTLAVYTWVARSIPQVESAVPEAVEIGTDVSPEELIRIGEEIYYGAGNCTSCHGGGSRAPDLLGQIGTSCGTREPGKSCKIYLYESLVDPEAYEVEGFAPIMVSQAGLFSGGQLWALVAFLQNEGGEVTVTSQDLAAAAEGGGGETTAGGSPPGPAGFVTMSLDPRELIRAHGCLACHVLDEEGGPVGPPFAEVRDRDREYLRRSILLPNADTAQGYEAFAGTMLPDFGDRLTAAQLEALVDFLKNPEAYPAPSGGS